MSILLNFFKTKGHQVAAGALLLITVLLPIIVLPLNDNFLVDSKTYLLLMGAIFIALIWTINSLAKKSLQVTLSPFLLPLILFCVSVLLSSFLTGGLAIRHLLGIGGIYLAYIVIVIFGSSLLHKKAALKFLPVLSIPAILLSVMSFAELSQFGPSRALNMLLKTQFPNSLMFSVTGSPVITAQILGVTLVGIIAALLSSKKRRSSFMFLIAGLVVTAGLLLNLYSSYQIFSSNNLLLPYSASYSIAIDTLKSARAAAIGVGPENFLHSYLALKPGWLNQTSLWNIQFGQASNFPFTILATLGLLGLTSWLLLCFQAIKQARRSLKVGNTESVPLMAIFFATLVLQLLLPINVILMGIQAVALAFWIASEKGTLKDVQLHAFTVQLTQANEEAQKVPKHSNVLVYLMSLILAIVILISGYWTNRVAFAQYITFQASRAAAANDAVKTYELQQRAIRFNPYMDSYRRKYSLTNMAIASALSQTKNPSEEDKQKVATLVQQAVREAKAGTTIDPLNNLNWITLANIYSNLIGVTKEAASWTVAAYSKAIEVSPLDPAAHVELGGVFYRLESYQRATQVFERAVILKPDWANAYYNLANSYRKEKNYSQAIAAYQQALSLVAGSEEEASKVSKELEDTRAEAAVAQPAAPTKAAAGTTPPTRQEVTQPATNESQLSAPTAATPAGQVSPEVQDAIDPSTLQGP